MFKTSEVTSYEIPSDNVLNNRLFFAYKKAAELVQGNLLEIGCGTGKGLTVFAERCKHYTAVDKNKKLLQHLAGLYPRFTFINCLVPPLKGLADNSFDTVVGLQVIEHIKDDHYFLQEVRRVLKPNGKAIFTTPNVNFTLSRNPWHVREYTPEQLRTLLEEHFPGKVQLMGIKGSQAVMKYHEQNRISVQRIMRWDVFDLQHRLPRKLLQIPYEILNRINRNRLMQQDSELVSNITLQDFSLHYDLNQCLDLFAIVSK
ncbi:MAG: class I SAM-dependent methyltransferase [Cytophagales bacterium]|nr:class I SAM-dependent methyltransferase [Bernardetiaceae bacterium]MDW8211203.1 class I SAM-dependent methyltransferase [Cytophagales bacterium]